MTAQTKVRTASSRRMLRGRFSRAMSSAGAGLTGSPAGSPIIDAARVAASHKNNDQSWKDEALSLYSD